MTDTPESDKAKIAFTSLFANDDAYWIPYAIGKKLERERDVAQKAMGDARDILLDAMPYANASTKILAEMIVTERDKYEESADALVDRLGATQERMINAERERDEIRAQLREEQQLHVQTLNERDEARGQLAGIENKMRGELGGHPDSELWGDAGLIAATMRCVDAIGEVTEQRDRLAAALEEACDNPTTGNWYREAQDALSLNQPTEP